MNRTLALSLCAVLLVWSAAASFAPAASAQPGPAPVGVWPLRPRPEVVRGFEPPDTPWGAGHRGVDLLGGPRQVVHAAQAGEVSFVGTIAGVAVVAVDAGATRMTYQPVIATVHPGERVDAGNPLGRLALFGSHCWPRWCLHWGLIAGRDHYLDPLTVLGLAPIRLLPLGEQPESGTEHPVGYWLRPISRLPMDGFFQ